MISKENELFHYSVYDTYVIIDSVKEDFPVVEFPNTLDGLPVKELAGYVLSGKNCEEVYIPEGIEKIGRYGFYNCRNLRKLSFSSDFMDLGSGAFTGCHKIRELDVLMKDEKTCLREILVEIPEEVCVRLIWKDKEALLWFPEFFEENVENTPARILSVRTHGSGMFYRYCFQGKVFQIQEYDKKFKNACVFESDKFLGELVYGRLLYPVNLEENAKAVYEAFMWEHKEQIAKYWIIDKKEEALEWLLANFPHGKDEKDKYQDLLELASKQGTTSMVSSLMDYGRRLFPPKRKSFDL